MASPIAQILDQIAASPFRVAPEAAGPLGEVVSQKGLTLELRTSEALFAEIALISGVVRLGVPFLEVLWSASYAYFVILNEYQAAQRRGDKFFKVGGNDRSRRAYSLYRTLLVSHAGGTPASWPPDALRPQPSPPHGSDEHVANELFLVAISWVIHHEIAHARLNHSVYTVNSVQQEVHADREATRWICEGERERGPLHKRALGIVAANLTLLAYDLEKGRIRFLTHPPSFERLIDNLDAVGLGEDESIYAFAFVLLDVLLAQAGLEIDVDRASPYRDMCVSACLALHGFSRAGA